MSNTTPQAIIAMADAAPQPASIKPSDVTRSAIQEIAAAMAAIRRQWADAKGEDLTRLFTQYDECFDRLRRLRFANLRDIDRDPEIKTAREQLASITLAMQKATREMKSVKRTIDRGVEILGYADRIIKILARFL